MLKVQRDGTVYVRACRTRVAVLIGDAWNVEVPPVTRLRHTSGPMRGKFAAKPTYEDGRVISLADFRKTTI